MGKQLRIDGEEKDVEEDKTVAELKEETNASENDITVYTDGNDEMVALSDKDTVADIPEGSTVTSQPQKGRIFGMDEKRTMQEIIPLQQWRPVDYDLRERRVTLEQVPFPAGWQPDAGDIRFKLPKDYPKSQPKVYVSGEMRYHGNRPHAMHRPRKGWAKWCIHRLKWDRGRHTLVTLTRMLMTSLNDPTTANPVRNTV